MPERGCDFSALAAIHAASFTTPRPWSAAEIADLAGLPYNFLIAQGAGFVMGQAIAGEAELLTIAVDPAARGQGQGGLLLQAFLDRARTLGAERAFLEVAADNGPAIRLYSRAGFSQSGRRKGYYHHPNGAREDAIMMALSL